jgi:hypothetical protein
VPRGWTWRHVTRSIIVAAGVAVAVLIAIVSLDRGAYFFYDDKHRAMWRYPTVFVAVTLGFATTETWIAWRAFDPAYTGRVWRRAVGALAFLGIWGWSLLFTVIHAPGFHIVNIVWIWVLNLVLLVTAAISGGSHVRDFLRTRRG